MPSPITTNVPAVRHKLAIALGSTLLLSAASHAQAIAANKPDTSKKSEQSTHEAPTRWATQLPSPSVNSLRHEADTIAGILKVLKSQLADESQQKAQQQHYENELAALEKKLEKAWQTNQAQQQTLTQQLKTLDEQKTELSNEQALYRQAHQALEPVVTQADFVVPQSINFRSTAHNGSYFRRVASYNRWNKPLTPLLQRTEALYCAETPDEAAIQLRQFFGISPPEHHWPDEWLGGKPNHAALYAGSMDTLLTTLHRTIERFPELRELAERVTLQWNYCPVTGDGRRFQNLLLNGKTLISREAAPNVPFEWSGFKRWGFMASPVANPERYVPELLDIHSFRYAYEVFLHRVYRHHCFPHPDTGNLYTLLNQEPKPVLTRAFQSPMDTPSDPEPYPFNWLPACEIPEVKQPLQAVWPRHLLQRASFKQQRFKQAAEALAEKVTQLKTQQQSNSTAFNTLKTELTQTITNLKTKEKKRQATLQKQRDEIRIQEQRLAEKQQSLKRQQLAQQEAEKKRIAALRAEQARQALVAREAEEKRIAALKAEQEAEKKRIAALKAKQEAEKKRAAARKQEADRQKSLEALRKRLAARKPAITFVEEPPNDFIPIPDAASTEGIAPSIATAQSDKDKEKKLGLSATFIQTFQAEGPSSTKLSLGWKPATNWFTRAAFRYKDGEGLTYSWGFGYSDWRPGTTSFQLNNWGPIKPGEGLALNKSVMSVSHKIDSQTLRDHKLSSTLSVSKPLNGTPAINTSFQWSPKTNWYIRTTASQKLEGGPTKWSYGFGYFDWRPTTWRVEYSNYGSNRYPFDNFKDGAVTISRAWEF